MVTESQRLIAGLATVCFVSCGLSAAAAQLGDLTGRWQLFVDDHLIAEKTNVTRTYHAFDKHADNPLMVADKPWEGKTAYVYGTVLPDEDGTGYRTWYHSWDGEYRMLYATSEDGLRWEKPELGLTEYDGSKANNILFRITHENHNPQVIHTPWDPDLQRQYKMMYFEYGRTPPDCTVTGYRGAWSPDGVHWTECPGNPVLVDDPGDVGNFVWDPLGKRYLGYPKKFTEVRGDRRRCVGYSETTIFESWPETEMVLVPDEYDDRWVAETGVEGARTDFYGLCGFAYESMYIGFLWIFRITDGGNDGPIFVELVSSQDGVHWTRQEAPRTPILALGPEGAWDDGMLFTTNHPLAEGDTIKLYYGGFDVTHGSEGGNAGIGLATLRKDGFASLDAGDDVGIVTTKPLDNARGPLRVNYSAREGGWVKVEVLSGDGTVVPGYSREYCIPFTEDATDVRVCWGLVDQLPADGSPKQIRFFLKNASLYSFAADGGSGALSEDGTVNAQDVWEPVVLGPRHGGIVLLSDGTLKRFVSEGIGENTHRNYSVASLDGGVTWSESTFEYEGPRAFLPLLDRNGEYHLFPMVARREGKGRTIAVDYFIDIWHIKTRNHGTEWEEAKVIFKGYVGSINGVAQLSNGRIVLPFAEWRGDRSVGPPVGANVVTCVYSDDNGDTWKKSPAELTAPTYTDFNGSGYGACEPCIIELKDGRVYMLVRTDAGCLYHSYSNDGIHWERLRPTGFYGTDAPAGFTRLEDGRIVVFWNGCEKPPRVNGDGVYGGRDALHAAISDDECQSWRGYREVYRDPTRNESPPRRGDRGAAYPFPYLGNDGNVIFMTGQGRAGATLVFDPDWLLATHQEDDFSNGLEGWSVFKHFGPAQGWLQDRTQGPVLVPHPDSPSEQVLHVRRPDERPGDGAVWNFPMGREGTLTLRVRLQEGFGGAVISLMDRFFNPIDPNGDIKAVFTLPIKPDGGVSIRNSLEQGVWHSLQFEWDVSKRQCVVAVDGAPAVYLAPSYPAGRGINYVRIRSTAPSPDLAGLLIERVAVDVTN